jgi:hypothetical protein
VKKITLLLSDEQVATLMRTGELRIEASGGHVPYTALTDTELEQLYYSGKSGYELSKSYGGSQMRFSRGWRLLGLDTSIPARERPHLLQD